MMKKMKFRTQFDNHKRVIAVSGSKEIMDYEKRLNSKGQTVIKEKGLKNIYDRIQEHKGEDIKSMIKKLSKQEQKQFTSPKEIYKSEGDVYDLRDMPESMPQAIQMINDAKLKFSQLPVEIKKEFNNNYMEFHAMVNKDNKTFEEKINKHLNKKKTVEQVVQTAPTQTTTTENKEVL